MGSNVYHISMVYLFKYLLIPLMASSSSDVPTMLPTKGVGLPPQAVPVTFSPTLFFSEEQRAVQFRIKAIGIMFSVAGFIFFLILVHYVYNTLSKKNWERDNNDGVKNNKWEALEEHEEQQKLLDEISLGIRKPESGVQWDETVFGNADLPTLAPSCTKEHHFEMQWENPESNICQHDITLIANPSRWSSQSNAVLVTKKKTATEQASSSTSASHPIITGLSHSTPSPVYDATGPDIELPPRERLPPLNMPQTASTATSPGQAHTVIAVGIGGDRQRQVRIVRKRNPPPASP